MNVKTKVAPDGEEKKSHCTKYTFEEASRVLQWFDHHYHKNLKSTDHLGNYMEGNPDKGKMIDTAGISLEHGDRKENHVQKEGTLSGFDEQCRRELVSLRACCDQGWVLTDKCLMYKYH